MCSQYRRRLQCCCYLSYWYSPSQEGSGRSRKVTKPPCQWALHSPRKSEHETLAFSSYLVTYPQRRLHPLGQYDWLSDRIPSTDESTCTQGIFQIYSYIFFFQLWKVLNSLRGKINNSILINFKNGLVHFIVHVYFKAKSFDNFLKYLYML